MIPLFPSCTWAWIDNKYFFFAVWNVFTRFCFAFVIRLSKWLFCDIWSSFFTQNEYDPFILKHYLLIINIIVYHVSSIQVSVFIQVIYWANLLP